MDALTVAALKEEIRFKFAFKVAGAAFDFALVVSRIVWMFD